VSIWEAGGVLFALDVARRGSWTVLTLTGELELATVPQVRQQVVSLVGDRRAHLMVDLSGVDFIDSVGLGLLVSILKRVRSHGGDLLVAGVSPRARALLELTRLDEIIEVYPSVEAAVAARPDPPPAVVGDDG
jgi:anti-sigma B factor antagonist